MLENNSFESFIFDQLGGLIEFESKRMFGGIVLLYKGSAFAKINHNKVWLKADESNLAYFERFGMEQYTYGKDNSRKLNFYETPAEVIEDRDEFVCWAKGSIGLIKKIHSQ
jgi:TfoX/Sxy family transcriptional regulator of competence genes